jgi:hypothetical protein
VLAADKDQSPGEQLVLYVAKSLVRGFERLAHVLGDFESFWNRSAPQPIGKLVWLSGVRA